MVTGLRPGQLATVTSRPAWRCPVWFVCSCWPGSSSAWSTRAGRCPENRDRIERPRSHENAATLPHPSLSPKKRRLEALAQPLRPRRPLSPSAARAGLLFLDSPAGEPKPPQGGFGGRRPRRGSSPARRRSRSATGGNCVPPRTVFARLRGRCSFIGGRRRDSAFRPPPGGTYQGPSHAANVRGTLSRCPARQGAGSPKGARRAAARCEARHSRFLPRQECPCTWCPWCLSTGQHG